MSEKKAWIKTTRCIVTIVYLVDVLGSRPSETASVVAADDVERRVVWGGVFREDAGHQRLSLSLLVVGRVLGHSDGRLQEHQ